MTLGRVTARRPLSGAKRLLAIVMAVFVLGCGGPDAAHYEAVLDELNIPTSWELVHTTVNSPGGLEDCAPIFPQCPSVARYYLVPGEPVDAYPDVKQFLATAGFALESDSGPACDLPTGGPACVLFGVRDSDTVGVSLFNRDTGPPEIAEKERLIVLIMAEGK